MAIRTNSVSYFRTTYTGSETPSTASGTNQFPTMGVGNELSTPSASQIVHFSEQTRSYFDYSLLMYFRDANTPTATVTGKRNWAYFKDDKNLVPSVSPLNAFSVNFSQGTLSPGQSGDPYSQMYACTNLVTTNVVGYVDYMNQSSSFDTLYWSYAAQGTYIIGGTATGVSNRLYTTYTYDDSTTTRNTKTVRIPVNSLVGSSICGPTLQLLDSEGAIPALDTFLPEATKSIIDIVVEFYSFTSLNAASNFQLLYNIDSGTTYSGSLYYGTANGAVFGYDTWRLYTSSLDTSTSHSIYVGSTLNNTFSQIGAIVNVTYTYDVATTTRTLNSVAIVGVDDDGTMQTSAAPNSLMYEYLLTEPGNITLRQSGYLMFASCAATQTVSFRCGNQPFVNYRLLQGSVNSGMYPIIHRIDSLSTGSEAFTLTRGYNQIYTEWYANAINVVGGFSGLLLLNYESDVSEMGIGAHAHTIYTTMTQSNVANVQQLNSEWPTYTGIIPESHYFIVDATPVVYRYTNSAVDPAQVYVYYTGSETASTGDGYETLSTSLFRGDAEYGTRISTSKMRNFIKRYPTYPNPDRIDLLNRRNYTFQSTANVAYSAEMLLTYRSIYFNITGSILNYTGDGSMPIKVIDTVKNRIILSNSSSAGGNISEVWYEDVNNLQIIAYNSSSYAVSDIKPAGSGSYTINFASSSAVVSGEHAYTWIG